MNAPASRTYDVLVVDDEEPARQRILDILRLDPRLGLVEEVADGPSAVRAIAAHRFDIVLLDVKMPELSGFQVIGTIGIAHMPLTIFVTAFDSHAIEAFETNALDYLLKPYSDGRLRAAIDRAIDRLGELALRDFGDSVRRLIATTGANPIYLERIAVKARGTTHVVPVRDIEWIEGNGVYVTLHLANRRFLHRTSLSELVQRLDPATFLRVHRSAIVNVEAIAKLESLSHGEFELVFKSAARTRASRTFRAALEARLGRVNTSRLP